MGNAKIPTALRNVDLTGGNLVRSETLYTTALTAQLILSLSSADIDSGKAPISRRFSLESLKKDKRVRSKDCASMVANRSDVRPFILNISCCPRSGSSTFVKLGVFLSADCLKFFNLVYLVAET